MKRLLAIIAAILPLCAGAESHRSQSARMHFVKANACPATGANKLPCPGYVIDHIKPLCAGGADDPSNMQWQARADSLAKDRNEKAQCAALRKEK